MHIIGGFEIVCAQLLMPRNFLYFWNNKIHVSSSGRNKVAQNKKIKILMWVYSKIMGKNPT